MIVRMMCFVIVSIVCYWILFPNLVYAADDVVFFTLLMLRLRTMFIFLATLVLRVICHFCP